MHTLSSSSEDNDIFTLVLFTTNSTGGIAMKLFFSEQFHNRIENYNTLIPEFFAAKRAQSFFKSFCFGSVQSRTMDWLCY